MDNRLSLLAALVVVAALVGHGAARAEPTPVALTPIEAAKKRDGRKIDRAIARALKKHKDAARIAATEEPTDVRLEGELTREGRDRTLTIRIVETGADAVVHVVLFEGRSVKQITRQIRKQLWTETKDAIAEIQARVTALANTPPEPVKPPEPVEPITPDPIITEPVEPPDDEAGGPTALAATLGARLFGRNFSYNDNLGALKGYEITAGPALVADVFWYPGAHFTDGIGAHFGLHLAGHFVIGIDSEDDAGNTFGTSGMGALAGVVGRLPLAAHELNLQIGFGVDSYELDGSSPVPSTGYSFVRLGGVARLAFGLLSVTAGGAYLVVLDSGDIGSDDWFPRADVGGFDAHLTVGVAIAAGLGVEAGFEVRHFYFTLNPEPGDPWIAGGATDTYLMGSVRLTYRLGG